jgi:hypothetical protein
VNFFGHAAAACRVDDDPSFILGAMAPDLLPLCGAVAGGETSPRVTAGQAHHHAVDLLFHDNPAFTTLASWASRALIEVGLHRGAARGAAHVGIELCLDGVLSAETGARAAYTRSLAEAETTGTPFVWRDELSRSRWRTLVLRLRAGAVPDGYRDPAFVADRVIGALGGRPRLALSAQEAVLLHRFLPALAARVAAEAHALTGDLVWRPAVKPVTPV